MTVVTRNRPGFALIVGGEILAVILLCVAGIACRPPFVGDGAMTRSGRARDALSQAGATVTEHTTIAGPGLGTARVYAVDFSDTGLTNEQLAAAIPYLNDLSGVQRLNLRGTQVDDAGLASLSGVKNLYVVDVTDARVTAEGIGKLRDGRAYPLVVDNSGPRAFDHEGCQDLLFSPDGKFLAIVDAQGTAIWNVETDELVAEFRGGSSAAFSADGSLLAIGHVNGVEVWNLLTDHQSLSLPIRNQSPSGVAFSADSKSLFVWEFGQTQQYELAKGRHLATHEGLLLGRSRTTAWFHLDPRVTKPMIHPDQGPLEGKITKELTWVAGLCVVNAEGARIAWAPNIATHPSADAVVHIGDLASGEEIQTLDPPTGILLAGAFDGSGQRLVVGGSAAQTSDGVIYVYDVAVNKLLLEQRDSAGTTIQVALTRDGRKIAAAFEHGSVKWWPVEQ